MNSKLKEIMAPLTIDPGVKILYVGVGNRLKSDDAIGIYICERLEISKQKEVLIVEAGIEKFVGKINSLAPDILVLVDCTDFNKKPGYINLFPVSEIPDNTFHTHTISLGRISEFFEMKTYILGIQPDFVGFGEDISPQVMEQANELISFLNNL